MNLRITCECGAKYTITKQSHLGRKLKCGRCQRVIEIPSASIEEPIEVKEPTVLSKIRSFKLRLPGRKDAAWNVPVTIAWLILGFAVALKAPWFAFVPAWLAIVLNTTPLLISVGIFVWNLRQTILAIGHVGNALVALPLTFCQIALFALFFFQISCHWDAHAFTYDRTPGIVDWLGFTLVHTLGAADLVDTFEAYGLDLKSIDSDSWIASWSLIIFHITVDLFILRLLMDFVTRRRKLIERHVELQGWDEILKYFAAIFVLVWLGIALSFRPWRWADLALWPLDNFLRVIDVADLMQIFHIRLHRVPQFVLEGTLAFVCRLLLAIALAKWLNYLNEYFSLQFFNGFGLGLDELTKIAHEHPNSKTQERARRALKQALTKPVRRVTWFCPVQLGYSVAVALLLSFLVLVSTPFGPAATVLAKVAVGPDDDAAQRAFHSLRVLGVRASGAIDSLADALQANHQRTLDIVETLGYLGPSATLPLSQWAQVQTPDKKVVAIEALGRIGPAAVPQLLEIHDTFHLPTRQAVEEAVISIGQAGNAQFVAALTPDNSGRVYGMLEAVNPYWFYTPSSNPELKRMRRLRDMTNQLLSNRSHAHSDELLDLGGYFHDLKRALRNDATRSSFGAVCKVKLEGDGHKYIWGPDISTEILYGDTPKRDLIFALGDDLERLERYRADLGPVLDEYLIARASWDTGAVVK